MKRATAPDNKRITVKLEASILPVPNAKRHSTELAAKAISAKLVNRLVFNKDLLITYTHLCIGGMYCFFTGKGIK